MNRTGAHVDLEGRIKLARHRPQYAALEALDTTTAYVSVEHVILLNIAKSMNFPPCITNWIWEFPKDRIFCCSPSSVSTPKYKFGGVPQGYVLTPFCFFNIMSSVPLCPHLQVCVYADGVAFFVSASDICPLHRMLQSYISILEDWFDDPNMPINVSKSTLIVFPLTIPVDVSLL